MRISDWSSDVCSSDLAARLSLLRYGRQRVLRMGQGGFRQDRRRRCLCLDRPRRRAYRPALFAETGLSQRRGLPDLRCHRSEEHTSELQSLMRISYAVFCLKKKTTITTYTTAITL